MCIVSTIDAAEVMLKSGSYFTARTLGEKLSVSAKDASGLLYNIRKGGKYESLETELPNRKVKVVSISGRKINENDLWRIALSLGGGKAA